MHAPIRCVAFLAVLLSTGAVAQPMRLPVDPCDEVKAFQPFEFKGRRYAIAPDVEAPELQRIDAVISTRGCLGRAQEMLYAYKAAHPDDDDADFMQARITWISGDVDEAEALMRRMLGKHPDFHGVKTLLGSLTRHHRGGAEAALPILQQVRKDSPGDVWGYVNYLAARLELPGGDQVVDEALAAIDAPAFPPNAREELIEAIAGERRLPEAAREHAARALLTFESMMPRFRRELFAAETLASAGKHAEAWPLVEPHLSDERMEIRTRMMFAMAWLGEAFRISRDRSEANAAQIAKAVQAFRGDEQQLAAFVRRQGQLQLLRLLSSYGSVDALDADGNTELCRAVLAGDSNVVNQLLDQQKADPNLACNGLAPLALFATRPYSDGLGAMIPIWLMRSGAVPDPVAIPRTGQRVSDYCLEDYERAMALGCRALRGQIREWAERAVQSGAM